MINKFNPAGDRYFVKKVECLAYEETRAVTVSEALGYAEAVAMLGQLRETDPRSTHCIQVIAKEL
jgi:hypothetical protein